MHANKIERRKDAPTTHLVTFSCQDRKPWLAHPRVRDRIAEQLKRATERNAIELHAWVCMSNHMHLLATDAAQPVHSWLVEFKRRFAQHERKSLASELPAEAMSGQFWLHGGGVARDIWSWQEFVQKERYAHENPIRAGICERSIDWRWSSAYDAEVEQRADMPVPSRPPEGLVDLLWWKAS